MARKGSKGKPTRKDIDTAIQKIFETINYIGSKIDYLDTFAKSTDLALELYVKYNNDSDKFKDYIEQWNKEQEEKAQKELGESAKKEANKKLSIQEPKENLDHTEAIGNPVEKNVAKK
tara:strand:+ start:2088 stop:2441 length:354 start_codon:yes stop_codon:yes gene_type:complete